MAPLSNLKPIFSIAGSDPSGGAGIQADLKTFCIAGVYGCAAVTCLTVQNTLGVAAYHALPADLVAHQIQLVLEDIKPGHIKIGMVGNEEIAAAIGQCLGNFNGPVFYDPVLLATSGDSLFNHNDCRVLFETLLNRVTVVTPNTAELQTLTNMDCTTESAIENAVRYLLAICPNLDAVAVTGGHLNISADTVTDFLFIRKQGGITHRAHSHPRLKTRNTHGTGCTFSSAFAAYHLLTDDYEKAFLKAGRMLEELINKSAGIQLGAGNGPLFHHLFDRKA